MIIGLEDSSVLSSQTGATGAALTRPSAPDLRSCRGRKQDDRATAYCSSTAHIRKACKHATDVGQARGFVLTGITGLT